MGVRILKMCITYLVSQKRALGGGSKARKISGTHTTTIQKLKNRNLAKTPPFLGKSAPFFAYSENVDFSVDGDGEGKKCITANEPQLLSTFFCPAIRGTYQL